MNEELQGAEEQSQAFIVHRHLNWLFMLDATEYKATGVAHFMIAFGKETVYHAKFITEDDQAAWLIREPGGNILAMQWDQMIVNVKELIDESEMMGLVAQKHQLFTDFDQVFAVNKVLDLL